MVDVGNKASTHRIAKASGQISMMESTFAAIKANQSGGTSEIRKGDVLATARIAAIMGAKRTAEIIPLCHPLMLTNIEVKFELVENKSKINCLASVETFGKTGVEMEALTAVQIALLTIYDMCKALDKGMEIGNVCLTHKSGGRSSTLETV